MGHFVFGAVMVEGRAVEVPLLVDLFLGDWLSEHLVVCTHLRYVHAICSTSNQLISSLSEALLVMLWCGFISLDFCIMIYQYGFFVALIFCFVLNAHMLKVDTGFMTLFANIWPIFFASQISKALTGTLNGTDKKDLMKKLPKFLYDEEKALEVCSSPSLKKANYILSHPTWIINV